MPKVTKKLGNNKARAWESLGFAHKKKLCQHFDTTSSMQYSLSVLALQKYIFLFAILLQICLEITLIIELQFFIETTKKHATRLQIIRSNFADKR